MNRRLLSLLAAPALLLSTAAIAQPEYVTIAMEIDVDRPAEETWAKVGEYCDISEWLNLDCVVTSGDGGIGTVRVLANGRITEIMVARTELSYGYTQPPVEGQFYNLYHGFMEARPTGANTSTVLYTLVLDVSNLADQAAKDAEVTRRRATFERALGAMKGIVEQQ
jgi:hypothetical protein